MASYTAQSREAERAPLPIDSRKDRWWVGPLYTVIVLTAFGIYTTFRAFENTLFSYPWPASALTPQEIDHAVHTATYLSPFYSPYIPVHLSIGVFALSPAFYILIFPLSFRLTCYYYRKAYYRAFFWDPPACAVAEPMAESRMKYLGERAFPFILQNLHRFAFYAAAVFIFILGWDAIKAFIWTAGDGTRRFGIGLGTIIMVVNVLALAAYTFGCHSWRHLIGGSTNCYSCSNMARTRYGLWKQVSFLNARHSLYAWTSLYTVALTDLYIRLVAAGVIPDPHIIF